MAWEMQKLNYSHDALVDQILANPTASNSELGAVFGRSKEWVSMVKNSGMFRERMAARKGDLVDPVLTASIEERLEMLTRRSIEVLSEKLAKPSQDISDDLALQAAAFGAKGMGVGGFSSKAPPPAQVVDVGRIERLADRLTNLNRPQLNQEIVDVEVR